MSKQTHGLSFEPMKEGRVSFLSKHYVFSSRQARGLLRVQHLISIQRTILNLVQVILNRAPFILLNYFAPPITF